MLEQHGDVLDNLTQLKSPDTVGQPLLIPTPFEELSELRDFDDTVNEVKEQLVVELSTLGGDTVAVATRKALNYIMTDEVARQYSWLGNKGKEKFCNLNIAPIIISAVRSNKKYAATVNEVENVIKRWLQHAPCRLKQLQERLARKSEMSTTQAIIRDQMPA
ncbi:uncharacterized protein LOC144167062 [Haemaphysalis longicornis]